MQAYWRAIETVNGAQVAFAVPPAPQAPEWAPVRISEGRDQLVRFEAPLDCMLQRVFQFAPSVLSHCAMSVLTFPVVSALPEEVLNWESPAAGPAPLSIMMSTATPGTANVVDTEIVTARVQKNAANDTYCARAQRVRVRFRGRFYVVYEIFGAAENGPSGAQAATSTASGRECVICITDPRDTVVLPCRRMDLIE